jgi:hypothetical protein
MFIRSHFVSIRLHALLLLSLFAIFSTSSFAQEQDVIPPDAEPPPIKSLSKDEKIRLAASKDVKERTKLTLELMDARVKVAEQYLPQDQLESVFRELGGFHALVLDALEYLAASDTNKKKQLDNFKRFEIGLRTFTHRLELIRREMPPQREYYVRLLLREMRDARAKAVEPLFGEIKGSIEPPLPE